MELQSTVLAMHLRGNINGLIIIWQYHFYSLPFWSPNSAFTLTPIFSTSPNEQLKILSSHSIWFLFLDLWSMPVVSIRFMCRTIIIILKTKNHLFCPPTPHMCILRDRHRIISTVSLLWEVEK